MCRIPTTHEFADIRNRYAETPLTEAEFKMLTPRDQDRVKRMALKREADGYASAFSGLWGSTNAVPYNRCRRIGAYSVHVSSDYKLYY